MPEQANAFPRKHFFLEMFTRDISLEECILDLIDNSIDALVKTKNIDISSVVFKKGESRPPPSSLPRVDVELSDKEFKIAEFYRRRGKTDAALFYYRQVERRHPNTDEAKQATGLNKLSDQELANLNSWLDPDKVLSGDPSPLAD